MGEHALDNLVQMILHSVICMHLTKLGLDFYLVILA